MEVTDQQKKEIQETFDLFDVDHDGRVTTKEMGTIIRAFFIVANDGQLRAFLDRLDKNGDGYVDYADFERFMVEEELTTVCRDEMDDDLSAAFQVFDKDGNGFIDADEFKDVMVNLGDKMTTEEVEALMKEADTDGDGKIDYTEFCRHMKRNILLEDGKG
ncbi:uncharacterized protein [Haliotis asinina]|uniref:uncharacterized protein isoform X1 n=1 Tax=Haliotis asinina TaxID=109174 RepID=UPI0035322BB1